MILDALRGVFLYKKRQVPVHWESGAASDLLPNPCFLFQRPDHPASPSPGRLPQRVQQVQQGQERVVHEHARAGIAHHAADGLPSVGSVTVHRALGAGGLIRAEGAARHPLCSVIRQSAAIRTHFLPLRVVMRPAVQGDHLMCGSGFAFQAPGGRQI